MELKGFIENNLNCNINADYLNIIEKLNEVYNSNIQNLVIHSKVDDNISNILNLFMLHTTLKNPKNKYINIKNSNINCIKSMDFCKNISLKNNIKLIPDKISKTLLNIYVLNKKLGEIYFTYYRNYICGKRAGYCNIDKNLYTGSIILDYPNETFNNDIFNTDIYTKMIKDSYIKNNLRFFDTFIKPRRATINTPIIIVDQKEIQTDLATHILNTMDCLYLDLYNEKIY